MAIGPTATLCTDQVTQNRMIDPKESSMNHHGRQTTRNTQKVQRLRMSKPQGRAKQTEPFDAADLCRRLEALQDILQQKEQRRKEKKAGYVKASSSEHYVPQVAASEFFRTATPDTFTRRKPCQKLSRTEQKGSTVAKTDVKPKTPPNPLVEASVGSDPATTRALTFATQHVQANPDPHQPCIRIVLEPVDEDYGSRNPGDRPNWTQFDENPILPRHGVRTLVTPLLRHMPSKARTRSVSISVEPETTKTGASSHRRRKSSFSLSRGQKLQET